jgi:hypothetical protein
MKIEKKSPVFHPIGVDGELGLAFTQHPHNYEDEF